MRVAQRGVLYTVRTSSAPAYSYRCEVERCRGYGMGMHETAMRAIGIGTILTGVSNFLVFDRTSTQLTPTLSLVAVW
jgi:hypothetical protein